MVAIWEAMVTVLADERKPYVCLRRPHWRPPGCQIERGISFLPFYSQFIRDAIIAWLNFLNLRLRKSPFSASGQIAGNAFLLNRSDLSDKAPLTYQTWICLTFDAEAQFLRSQVFASVVSSINLTLHVLNARY
ncbi:hypothetical protein ANRL3_02072 [Anaerolineae bacterium]|nr:hypothetical protein ANRL3_02072 [Anaerolineae bacterium]